MNGKCFSRLSLDFAVVDLLDGCRVIETLEEKIARRERLQTDAHVKISRLPTSAI